MQNERIGWAVDVVAPGAAERILEIGCGHGLAAAMVCDRLVNGRLVAVDRSSAMVNAARRRNAAHVAAGRLEFHVVELARLDLGDARFDKAFALRLGSFARGDPVRELTVLGTCRRRAGSFSFTTNRRAGRTRLRDGSRRV